MSHSTELSPGLRGNATLTVTEAYTARALGSGTLDILATPMLVAVMEAAAVDCVDQYLSPGVTSLGIELGVTHIAPTPVGLNVTATARLTKVDDRRLEFDLEARDERDVIGRARHVRAIVETERFLSKVRLKMPG